MLLHIHRFLMVAVPVGAAIGLLVMAVQNKEPPAQAATGAARTSQTVRAMIVEPRPFVPAVTGHGLADAHASWRAVVQVSGTVERLADELEDGAFLPAGTEIAVIDDAEYRAELRRAEASLAAARATLAERRVEESNTEDMAALERRKLALQSTETARQRALAERGTTTESNRDAAERTLLNAEAALMERENRLKELPSEIARLEADVAAAEAEVVLARIDLARTRILLPADARIASVGVERGEHVVAGAEIARADLIDRAEIEVRIPQAVFDRFTALIGDDGSDEMLPGVAVEIRDPDRPGAAWEGSVERVTAGIDAGSRMVGVTVSVEDPYGRTRGKVSTPLRKGQFVAVTLRGESLPGRIAVPLAAVHDGMVYVAGPDDTLTSRPVDVMAERDGIALLADGALEPGERVVLDEIAPAVEGMALDVETVPGPVATAGGPLRLSRAAP